MLSFLEYTPTIPSKNIIDMANHTLDVAIYNHSDNLITTAINDAHERGVRVRYITCRQQQQQHWGA